MQRSSCHHRHQCNLRAQRGIQRRGSGTGQGWEIEAVRSVVLRPHWQVDAPCVSTIRNSVYWYIKKFAHANGNLHNRASDLSLVLEVESHMATLPQNCQLTPSTASCHTADSLSQHVEKSTRRRFALNSRPGNFSPSDFRPGTWLRRGCGAVYRWPALESPPRAGLCLGASCVGDSPARQACTRRPPNKSQQSSG